MITTRRRPTKRNAPRRSGTGRSGNILLAETVIVHASPVNSGDRRSDRRGSREAARGAQ